MIRAILLTVCVFGLIPQPALANGRLPGATELTVDRSDSGHLIARATFGMVQSFDRGETWQWICERAVNVSGEADPPLAVTEDDTVVLLPPASGTLISRDRGCTWTPAPPPLLDKRAVDLTVDSADPARVLVLISAVASIDARGVVSYANELIETRDNARTWSEVSMLPATFFAETLEIAASDPQRIYVSGTSNMDPLLGVVQRTEDGGKTWIESSVKLPSGSGSMFISAIDPHQPDRLWARLPARGDRFGILPATLIMSSDKGASWDTLAATEHQAMLGFALSPDGSRLAYGGPGDGLFVGASDGSEGFSKVAELRVRCLRWYGDGLYACGTEATSGFQQGDPFSVGVSVDEGKSFRAIYTMASTCPQECPGSSGFEMLCKDVWSALAPSFEAEGDSCTVPWARSATSSPSATVADAGADADRAHASVASTGCSAAGGGRPGLLGMSLMLMILLRWKRAAVAAFVGLLGCGDAVASEPDAETFIACPDTIPELAHGTRFGGRAGHLRVELIEASPLPARKYRNDWVIALTDSSGEPVGDVDIKRLEAFMPVHGHYSRPPAVFEPRRQPGQFDTTIYFTMRGPWEVQLDATSVTDGDDYVVLDVCVDD